MPESYVSSRPRPTIPRPPSCPAVPISHRPSNQPNLNYKSNNQRVSFSHHPSIQPNVNYKSNNQRWKFRPTTGASAKKSDAVERDLKCHLEKVIKSIDTIPSNVSKLLEEAVTYIDSSVNHHAGQSVLNTVLAINGIKNSLNEIKTAQVESSELQREIRDKSSKLDDICNANKDIFASFERQDKDIAIVKEFVSNPEKESEVQEINKLKSSLDNIIQVVGDCRLYSRNSE